MVYRLLEIENLPDVLKNKPRWVSCLLFTGGFLAVTLSAVCIGIFLGYTYCYFEHRVGFKTGNITQSTTMELLKLPYPDSEEARYNRTLHGAIMSSTFVSKIVKLSHALTEDDSECGPVNQSPGKTNNNNK